MADIKIVYDEERLTLGDLLEMEENSDSIRTQMSVLAKLVQNGDGEFVEPQEGFELLKQFSVGDLRRASEQIQDAAQGMAADPK